MTTRWTDPDLEEFAKKALCARGRSFLGMRPVFAGVATPLLAGLLSVVGAAGLSSAAQPEEQGPPLVPRSLPQPPVWREGPVINPRNLPPIPSGPRVLRARPGISRVAAVDPGMVVSARPGIDEAMVHEGRPGIDPGMVVPAFPQMAPGAVVPASLAPSAVRVPARTTPGR